MTLAVWSVLGRRNQRLQTPNYTLVRDEPASLPSNCHRNSHPRVHLWTFAHAVNGQVAVPGCGREKSPFLGVVQAFFFGGVRSVARASFMR